MNTEYAWWLVAVIMTGVGAVLFLAVGRIPEIEDDDGSRAVGIPEGAGPDDEPWWTRGVVYEVYIRSFADADGDGSGDIEGIRQRLPYLRALGVDAIWITPWYPSPLADGGYDVADHRAIHPDFGTLEDADRLVHDAHEAGLRVLLDLVPNHTSAEHPWFRRALAEPAGSAARGRYIFRDGGGPAGDEAPNNWQSAFGGPAWTRVSEPDGRPGQWYLHLFAPEQPDLDWDSPEVRDEFEAILRFWFDRGIDGFRIDVAHGLVKEAGLPDVAPGVATAWPVPPDHPHWDRPGIHEIHRGWRRVADAYDPPRILVGEVTVTDQPRLTAYLRPDELNGAFNFLFMESEWDAAALRGAIDRSLASHARVRTLPTWVLSNHDATRHVTRLGRPFTGIRTRAEDDVLPSDVALGRRRARAAALLMLALPGAAYLYQGEELGLPEVEDLPVETLRDPVWTRSGGAIRGRDGCRVPLPWSGTSPPFGFGSAGTSPWLPQPAAWAELTVEAQLDDPGSMLELYRAALRLRRAHPGLRGTTLRWLASPPGTLHFERGNGLHVAVNLAAGPMPLPAGRRTLLASGAPGDGPLGVDEAAWFEITG